MNGVQYKLAKIKVAKPDVIYSPDASFFFAGGMAKIRDFKINAPVYSTYVTELPVIRSLVEGVIYSFPNNIYGSEGGVYGLSQNAAGVISRIIYVCKNNILCAQREALGINLFDSNGTSIRGIHMKHIQNGISAII